MRDVEELRLESKMTLPGRKRPGLGVSDPERQNPVLRRKGAFRARLVGINQRFKQFVKEGNERAFFTNACHQYINAVEELKNEYSDILKNHLSDSGDEQRTDAAGRERLQLENGAVPKEPRARFPQQNTANFGAFSDLHSGRPDKDQLQNDGRRTVGFASPAGIYAAQRAKPMFPPPGMKQNWSQEAPSVQSPTPQPSVPKPAMSSLFGGKPAAPENGETKAKTNFGFPKPSSAFGQPASTPELFKPAEKTDRTGEGSSAPVFGRIPTPMPNISHRSSFSFQNKSSAAPSLPTVNESAHFNLSQGQAIQSGGEGIFRMSARTGMPRNLFGVGETTTTEEQGEDPSEENADMEGIPEEGGSDDANRRETDQSELDYGVSGQEDEESGEEGSGVEVDELDVEGYEESEEPEQIDLLDDDDDNNEQQPGDDTVEKTTDIQPATGGFKFGLPPGESGPKLSLGDTDFGGSCRVGTPTRTQEAEPTQPAAVSGSQFKFGLPAGETGDTVSFGKPNFGSNYRFGTPPAADTTDDDAKKVEQTKDNKEASAAPGNAKGGVLGFGNGKSSGQVGAFGTNPPFFGGAASQPAFGAFGAGVGSNTGLLGAPAAFTSPGTSFEGQQASKPLASAQIAFGTAFGSSSGPALGGTPSLFIPLPAASAPIQSSASPVLSPTPLFGAPSSSKPLFGGFGNKTGSSNSELSPPSLPVGDRKKQTFDNQSTTVSGFGGGFGSTGGAFGVPPPSSGLGQPNRGGFFVAPQGSNSFTAPAFGGSVFSNPVPGTSKGQTEEDGAKKEEPAVKVTDNEHFEIKFKSKAKVHRMDGSAWAQVGVGIVSVRISKRSDDAGTAWLYFTTDSGRVLMCTKLYNGMKAQIAGQNPKSVVTIGQFHEVKTVPGTEASKPTTKEQWVEATACVRVAKEDTAKELQRAIEQYQPQS